MANYFNSLPLRLQLEQLGVCEFMDNQNLMNSSFKRKKSSYCLVVEPKVKPRFNMRDSGLDISYAKS
jgi:ketol-acid reductoisomerase